jgi:hypothetical protein
LRTGLITSYLSLRYLVRSGFRNINRIFRREATIAFFNPATR